MGGEAEDRGPTLEEYVRERSGGRVGYRVLREVYDAVSDGSVRLQDPEPPAGFIDYLLRLDHALWFWSSLLVAALAAASAVIPIPVARYVFGIIFVMFVPGYVTIELLYPAEESLRPIERLALSIGVSLALTPVIGLALNFLPGGVSLTPFLLLEGAYIVMAGLAAAYRKYRAIEYSRKSVG